jgi:hypothetical protein
VRIVERAERKGVCISLLRNETVLRDVWKAEHRDGAAVYYIDFFSTEFHRFRTCCFRCSGGAAVRDRQTALSCSRRSVAFARNARASLHSTHLTRGV